jgi:hypothetical protein
VGGEGCSNNDLRPINPSTRTSQPDHDCDPLRNHYSLCLIPRNARLIRTQGAGPAQA